MANVNYEQLQYINTSFNSASVNTFYSLLTSNDAMDEKTLQKALYPEKAPLF